MTAKERLINIIEDAISNTCDYIVLKMYVVGSGIDIRNRYFGIEYMCQCLDIINKNYDDNLVSKRNKNVSIASAVGAYNTNTLEKIEKALIMNMSYIFE